MTEQEIIESYIGKNAIWKQVFDNVRIIEGNGSGNVCNLENGELTPTNEKCYGFWQKNRKCLNCVSKQACTKSKQMVKLEYLNEKYYLVIAKPIVLNGENYIVEFLANITTRLATGNISNDENNFVVDLMNQLETVSSREIYTGLYNKSHLMDLIDTKLSKNESSRKPLYLALIDIDNFKYINDKYGHAIGDKAILEIAHIIMDTIKDDKGIDCRFGGDEFAILFNDLSLQECDDLMKELENKIENTKFDCIDSSEKITLSYGLDDISKCNNFLDAIDFVDKKMYLNKRRKKIV